MDNFENDKAEKQLQLPNVEDVSVRMGAVLDLCDVTRLPELFNEAGSDTLPVINLQGVIVGIVSEHDMANIIPDWSFKENSYLCDIKVRDIMIEEVWTETKDTNIKNLMEKINNEHKRVIPIVEENNLYTGYSVTRTSIITYFTNLIKPNTLGGLATPLGVYITDGKHQAGTGNLGLFLTGLSLGSIFILIEQVFKFGYAYFNINEVNIALMPLIFILQILLFIVLLRQTPLAKIHAAEHQTINAIEKGIPLNLDSVKAQPREHNRCGTNLMVLLLGIQFIILLFVTVINKFAPFLQFIFLFWAFIYVFSSWKKWGMWLQKYFTTVDAPDKFILSGIKAGEEILRKHKEDLDAQPATFSRKIWCMGIIQIITGFMVIQNIFEYILTLI